MALLWIVTIGWAFSFSLIGVYLSGQVDDYLSVLIRTGLASLLFLPLMVRHWPGLTQALRLMGIGVLQIGLMYVFLFRAFNYLTVPELLLFTTLTPLYVTLVDDWVIGRRRLSSRWWFAAVMAVIAAGVMRWGEISSDAWFGFLLIQAANLCFASGQVLYKHLPIRNGINQVRDFGFFFIGGFVVASLASLVFGDWSMGPKTMMQWSILLWLGLGASGLGYLAWNLGARSVNTGQLAVMNNMLIPLGILVNAVIWNRDADWSRLAIGGLLLVVAVLLASQNQSKDEVALS